MLEVFFFFENSRDITYFQNTCSCLRFQLHWQDDLAHTSHVFHEARSLHRIYGTVSFTVWNTPLVVQINKALLLLVANVIKFFHPSLSAALNTIANCIQRRKFAVCTSFYVIFPNFMQSEHEMMTLFKVWLQGKRVTKRNNHALKING